MRAEEQRAAGEVLKGTARRVVILASPDPRIFEEAIFIVREDFLLSPETGQEELMREAEKAARGYVAVTLGHRRFSLYTCICRVISRLRRTIMRFSRRLI